MNKKSHDYAALKRRLFIQVLLMAAAAVLLVFLFRSLSSGMLADRIVSAVSSYFRIDRISASKIYFFGIRNFLDIILAIGAIGLFVLFLRFFINTVTKYLDEINAAVDSLSNSSAEIKLSPELSTIESSLRLLQQSIERKEALAQRTQQRKNDLVIYSAHDIKTPLTSVLGYLILLDGKSDLTAEERTKYTRIALDKTRELDGMINQLFEITRYNLNEIELEKSWLSLYEMLSEIKEEHYPQLKQAGKQTELHMAEDIRIFGDAEKLARVFNNIFKNAVLYSSGNNLISISASAKDNMAEISFENSCPPISEAKLKRLFDQFYRGREADSSSGSGLGLAIAKEIVLLHGGGIRAESTDSGIRFLIKLPIAPAESIKET